MPDTLPSLSSDLLSFSASAVPNSVAEGPIDLTALNVTLANPDDISSIIKVIGVGGGGGNAVANMYREGIRSVKYLVCNTDSKALHDSPVPAKLQLGPGLGAGGNPVKGRELATESIEDIRKSFGPETKMVFITAGMGGGTGTGASPVIAREARQRGILTIGIVTIPFLFEMQRQIDKALDGLDALAKEVDALLVVNNERLKDIYSNLTVLNGFKKADETLLTAVRSIVEITEMRGIMGCDFNDVKMVLQDGGVAVMSSGYGRGDHRVEQAISNAINSPLLNHNDIYCATRLVMVISFPDSEQHAMQMEELSEINDFMSNFRSDVQTKWGMMADSSLGDRIKVTILASGFSLYSSSSAAAQPSEGRVLTAKEERDLVRRGRFYGQTGVKHHAIRHFYKFNTDDLDNEELIAQLEQSPTCRRTTDELKAIRQWAEPATATTLDLSEPIELL